MNERYGGGVIKGKGKGNAPSFMEDRFLNGESKSIATIPILKICTPPPDMYSMNACIGKDLTGEIAKSQAFLVLRSSYEFNASAVLVVVAKTRTCRCHCCSILYPNNRYITVSIHSELFVLHHIAYT